jgi:hypothetical protein
MEAEQNDKNKNAPQVMLVHGRTEECPNQTAYIAFDLLRQSGHHQQGNRMSETNNQARANRDYVITPGPLLLASLKAVRAHPDSGNGFVAERDEELIAIPRYFVYEFPEHATVLAAKRLRFGFVHITVSFRHRYSFFDLTREQLSWSKSESQGQDAD